jgi:hypothetical protein
MSNTNSIQVLFPYKANDAWVFDDDRVGLVREPFVLGIDDMIEKIVENIPNAEKGFKLLFSDKKFPNADVSLEWMYSEAGGNWYSSPELNMKGWLCPALFKYYSEAPKNLWAKFESLQKKSTKEVSI